VKVWLNEKGSELNQNKFLWLTSSSALELKFW